jgi:peptidyl-prolyl cis-trans isomerase D
MEVSLFMLESMRQNVKSLQLFFWLVIVAFIGAPLIGALRGSFGKSGEGNAIAWVNGKPISFTSFEQEYRNIYGFYKQMYGDNLTRDVLENLQIEQTAINQLTQKALLVEEAQQYGLRVPNAELVNAIREIPQFQTNNQFDPDVYKNILSRARLTPQEFEDQTMENLLVKKLDYLIKQTVRISDQEVLEDYKVENEKVQVEGIFVKPEQFAENVEFADEDVTLYYDTHKETFKTPVRVKIQYILFVPQRIKEEVTTLTEEEIRQYYEDHESDFNKGKEVRARHILFRLDQYADEETEAAVKKNAEEILQKLKEGADFAEIAKEHSEDTTSGKEGGDLGFFSKGMMIPEFEEAAFALSEGEISDLVRTQFGYHIIKVEETREEPDPYGKAKPEISDRLKLEQAQFLALERAEDSYQDLLDTGDLQQIASNTGIEVHVSQFFARDEPIDEKIGRIPQIQEVAFTLSADEKFSQPVETSSGYAILEFLELKEPYIPELTEITEKVNEAVRQEKARELAKVEAQKIEEELKNGANWDEIIEKYSAEKFSPKPFSRRQLYISEVGGKAEEFVRVAFSLKEHENSSVIELSQDYCIIRLLERTGIDEEKFEEEKKSLKQRLLKQKQETIFREFVEELRQKADIKMSELITG